MLSKPHLFCFMSIKTPISQNQYAKNIKLWGNEEWDIVWPNVQFWNHTHYTQACFFWLSKIEHGSTFLKIIIYRRYCVFRYSDTSIDCARKKIGASPIWISRANRFFTVTVMMLYTYYIWNIFNHLYNLQPYNIYTPSHGIWQPSLEKRVHSLLETKCEIDCTWKIIIALTLFLIHTKKKMKIHNEFVTNSFC